ncbi:hypothetical protein ACGFXC_37025 [Streptomyces sp. NPDC048507]|uniref:hypothetical protein n=1 Tax=Streptomyces sp. NPDC048507 TaxID=3365560 RepID=UPI00370F7DC7
MPTPPPPSPDRPRRWMSVDAYLANVGETWATVRFTRPGQGLDRRPGSASLDGDAFDEAAQEARARRNAASPRAAATMRPVKPRRR